METVVWYLLPNLPWTKKGTQEEINNLSIGVDRFTAKQHTDRKRTKALPLMSDDRRANRAKKHRHKNTTWVPLTSLVKLTYNKLEGAVTV